MDGSDFDVPLPAHNTNYGRAGILVGMADEPIFTPPADEGQAGWVLLPDGRRGYRYEGSDDVIIHKEPAGEKT